MSPTALDSSRTNGSSINNFASIPQILDIPNLIAIQTESFKWLASEGIKQVLDGVSPLVDFTGTKYELSFHNHRFDPPKRSEAECKEEERTYSAPMYVTSRLVLKETGEIKEQDLFMGDLPLMTQHGTFIINGAERVVVSQLVRSPGAYFTADRDLNSNRILCNAKLIPYRGAWLEFETSTKDVISVKIDRKRKISVTTLLVALGVDMADAIGKVFSKVDTNTSHKYMQQTAERDPLPESTSVSLKERDLKTIWEVLCPSKTFNIRKAEAIGIAQLEVYRRLRPGEPPNLDNAWGLIKNLFFDERRYDIAQVGRYKLNTKLGLDIPMETRTLTLEDIFAVISMIISINNGQGEVDDIDNLGNRRVRAVGELIQKQLQVGLLRMERMVRERMTLIDPELATPQALVNIRPVVASIREFFGGSQLSQFMDQTNPLAELTHKRRLSALGPGGLSRDRAGFDVRDVHFSHYGRICPIETPEGPNIGLLSSLATYARINELGFIESPYRQVKQELQNNDDQLKGRTLGEDVLDDNGKLLAKQGRLIRNKTVDQLADLAPRMIKVRPFVSPSQDDIIYLSADKESEYTITHANEPLDDHNQFVNDRIEVRDGEKPALIPIERVNLMDVSPMQIVSVSASLIPFLEHDDANRALMGSNYQRQAVPLLKPQAPLVATGIEDRVARDSGQVVIAQTDGIVKSVTGKQITTSDSHNEDTVYDLIKFSRTNQGTCLNQKPIVHKGQNIAKGQILADSSSTEEGHLALGQNLLVAFMSWEGYNSDDAIILSEDLVKNDRLTSLHIEKYQVESRDTKQGPEEITRDIPHVGEENLENLDEIGIIRIGAEVEPGDILVGKVTPKGETELTAEEKLLRAIFGEKSRDVRDTSLRIPNGEGGTVIQVKALNRLDNAGDLSPGVNETVRVWVAQTRKISVGDKMSGRHGNKGVVARILPVEDMPYLPDGTPVDIILNPVGVPSRMNLGQVLETHLGWVAKNMKFRAFTPVFDGATDRDIEKGLAQVWLAQQAGALEENGKNGGTPIDTEKLSVWLDENGYDSKTVLSDNGDEARRISLKLSLDRAGIDVGDINENEMWEKARKLHIDGKIDSPVFGKTILTDGRTGEKFHNPVTIGEIYMMKLSHLVEDKIHARSTGPYSLITQQPLGGKAQFGGQRFGEMEVWALEAYSAAHNLQEMLTVKSDDVAGRVKTYEAIVKGEDVGDPGIPESFNVLLKELQSLGLSVQLINDEEHISDEQDETSDSEDQSLLNENSLLVENSILASDNLELNEDGTPVGSTDADLASNNPLANDVDTESGDKPPDATNAASEPDLGDAISPPESTPTEDKDSDGGA